MTSGLSGDGIRKCHQRIQPGEVRLQNVLGWMTRKTLQGLAGGEETT